MNADKILCTSLRENRGATGGETSEHEREKSIEIRKRGK